MLTIIVMLALVLAAALMCYVLIEIDRRIRAWFDYDVIHRQSMGEVDGADIIKAMREGEK